MRPAFGVLADRRRADERADFDRQPGALAISTIGVMSAIVVRAAQLARDLQPGVDDLARQPLDVARPRAGRRRAGRCRRCRCRACRSGGGSRSSASMVGVRTDGDCSPSRSVSSSSITRGGLRRRADLVPVVDQGFEHLPVGVGRPPAMRRRCRRRRSAASHTRGLPRGGRAPCGRKPSLMVSVGSPCWCRDDLRSRRTRGRRHARLPIERDVEDDDGQDEPQSDQREPRRLASFRSGVLHDQRRHVVVLLGAVGECP